MTCISREVVPSEEIRRLFCRRLSDRGFGTNHFRRAAAFGISICEPPPQHPVQAQERSDGWRIDSCAAFAHITVDDGSSSAYSVYGAGRDAERDERTVGAA
jgi:hypothetical protein